MDPHSTMLQGVIPQRIHSKNIHDSEIVKMMLLHGYEDEVSSEGNNIKYIAHNVLYESTSEFNEKLDQIE